MKQLKTLLGKGFNLGACGFLAAALTLAPLGLAAAPAAAATVVVDTTTDQATGDCIMSCSLRDAVATAAPGDTIQIPAGTYILTRGRINITKDLAIEGSGARTTVIDGNASSQIFAANAFINIAISDVTLTNGNNATGAGGAINFAFLTRLTLHRCTFANNQSRFQGAGANLQDISVLDIADSTFSNNRVSSTSGGGGLAVSGSPSGTGVTGSIVNSTFSDNLSVSGGGLQLSRVQLSLINNTITANQALANPPVTPRGGGILATSSTLTLSNNIIAGNLVASLPGNCSFSSTTPVTDHNLDSDNSCGFTGSGDLSGVDPLLGALANNGGPTDTHVLLAGSPALDAGGNATCPAADQRGITRPQRGICDIGAVEMVNVAPVLASDHASVTVNEGQTAANTGTVSDGNGDTVTLTASVGSVINHGDGTWSWSFATTDGPTQSQTVTITGNDGQGGTGTTTFSLVVNNVAPTIVSVSNNGPIIVGGSATITVTATDPAGANDPLTYRFDCNNDGIFEIGPQAGNSASCTFATTGSHTVNVRVADDDGGVTTGSTTVTVILPPPSCASATASPNLLWPPNHKFVAIHIGGIVNPAPGAVTVTVSSIFQDEPTSGAADATGVGTGAPSVRSERDGGGDGRVYHINFTATGASGSCTGSVTVGVPHDQGHGSLVDGGSLYNSTLP